MALTQTGYSDPNLCNGRTGSSVTGSPRSQDGSIMVIPAVTAMAIQFGLIIIVPDYFVLLNPSFELDSRNSLILAFP